MRDTFPGVSSLRVALQELGACERALEECARQRELLPQEILAAETKAQAAHDAVTGERERIQALDRRRRELETAVQDCESRRHKFQGQTALVKTNEEYRALLSEIDGQSRRISELEEEVLQLLEEIDRASEQLVETEREQERLGKSFTEEAGETRERLAEVERTFEARRAERATRVANLPAEARTRYEHVLKRRSTGIAEIRLGSCTACHRKVPPETINRTLAGELHTCHACQRILVHPVS